MRHTNRARGSRTGRGCGAGPAAPCRTPRRSACGRSSGWGVPGGGPLSGRSRCIPSGGCVPRRPSRRPVRCEGRCGAGRPDRGMDGWAWGMRSRLPRRGWRACWRWRGGPTTRNRGRRSSGVQPRQGTLRGLPCAAGTRRAAAEARRWAGTGSAVSSRWGRRSLAHGSTMPNRKGFRPVASGTAQRGNRLLRRGMHELRWVLAHGWWRVRLWMRPEPLPKRGDRITMQRYTPSQCLKLPSIPLFQPRRGSRAEGVGCIPRAPAQPIKSQIVFRRQGGSARSRSPAGNAHGRPERCMVWICLTARTPRAGWGSSIVVSLSSVAAKRRS